MVSDVFQDQKRGSWIPGMRAERVLANAISIDGRKEWTFKFCSESKVWTRWRCRRCYKNISAELHGKYRQAVAAKLGEWSTGPSASNKEDRKARCLKDENKELRARIDAVEKEGVQKEPGIPFKEEGEIAWKSRMRPSVAENWMNRGKRCRRSWERSTDCLRRASRSHCSTSCNMWRKRRNDLMPEHQKVQKRTQKIPSLQDKGRNLQQECLAAKEEMRKFREEIDWKEGRFRLLSDKVDKNRMADAEMEAELQ